MRTETDTEIETRLIEALRTRADAVPESEYTPQSEYTPRAAQSRPRFLVAAAVAGVIAVTGGVLAVLSPDRGPVVPAARPLSVAAVADGPGPSQFYYSHQVSVSRDGQRHEIELWQPQVRTDTWMRKASPNVIPLSGTGKCAPGKVANLQAVCSNPGSWVDPTPEFLAAATRDPAVLLAQLRAAAIADEKVRTGPNGVDRLAPGTFSTANLAYLELNYIRGAASANGVPDDLSRALEAAVAELPGVQVSPVARNLDGKPGISYSLPDYQGKLLSAMFDAHGYYIGSPNESFTRGVAPSLGAPPSRLFY